MSHKLCETYHAWWQVWRIVGVDSFCVSGWDTKASRIDVGSYLHFKKPAAESFNYCRYIAILRHVKIQQSSQDLSIGFAVCIQYIPTSASERKPSLQVWQSTAGFIDFRCPVLAMEWHKPLGTNARAWQGFSLKYCLLASNLHWMQETYFSNNKNPTDLEMSQAFQGVYFWHFHVVVS